MTGGTLTIGNKFLIGDAGSFASALTGERIYFAMPLGEDVAKTIINKDHNPLLIKRVLEIKRKHGFVLNILKTGKITTNIFHSLFLNLLNFNFFKNTTIELVC